MVKRSMELDHLTPKEKHDLHVSLDYDRKMRTVKKMREEQAAGTYPRDDFAPNKEQAMKEVKEHQLPHWKEK
jgi:hypothetical protein